MIYEKFQVRSSSSPALSPRHPGDEEEQQLQRVASCGDLRAHHGVRWSSAASAEYFRCDDDIRISRAATTAEEDCLPHFAGNSLSSLVPEPEPAQLDSGSPLLSSPEMSPES